MSLATTTSSSPPFTSRRATAAEKQDNEEKNVDSSVKTIIFPVSDPEKAKTIFTELLGVPPSADQPYYIGYDQGGQHIGLLPNGKSQGMTGPVSYWHVTDIDRKFASLIAAGA